MTSRTIKLLFIVFLLSIATLSPVSAEDSASNSGQSPERKFGPNIQTIEKIERREMKKDLMLEKKEEMIKKREDYKASMSAKRELFKDKIDELKDLRKKEIVERVDGKITTVDANQAQKWSEALVRLEGVVTRLSSESASLETEGKDISALNTAITNATAAINTAKTAVETQKEKDYVISIESESTLRTDVGQTTKQLKADLLATKKTVMDARLGVTKAVIELKKLKGEPIETNQ